MLTGNCKALTSLRLSFADRGLGTPRAPFNVAPMGEGRGNSTPSAHLHLRPMWAMGRTCTRRRAGGIKENTRLNDVTA